MRHTHVPALSYTFIVLAFAVPSALRPSSVAASSHGLKLVSISPAPGATHVCVDTPLRLVFDGSPVLSPSGTIQILDDTGTGLDSIDVSARTRSQTIGGLPNFNYYPVVITGNEAVIAFKNSILAHGKTYEVRISTGLFGDKEGNVVSLDGEKAWRWSGRSYHSER